MYRGLGLGQEHCLGDMQRPLIGELGGRFSGEKDERP